MEDRKQFQFKKFTSYCTFISFIILSITGVILYFTPHGSYSRWANWTFMFMSKDHIEGIHTVFSFVFMACIVVHLFNNLKIFLTYLRSDILKKTPGFRKEFAISMILMFVIFLGSILFLPPFSTLINFGEHLKESWEKTPVKAPISNFEELTLEDISKKVFNITSRQAISILNENSIRVIDDSQKIGDIANLNSSSPREIFLILQKKLQNI